MKLYARLRDDTIVEFIKEVNNIHEEWSQFLLDLCVDVTNITPTPELGWIYNPVSGRFSAPPPVILSPQQKMVTALRNGCQVTSASTPSLNATYDAVGLQWQMMKNELQYITAFGAFSGGLTELDWITLTGEVIFTTPIQFQNVARVIGDWITGWQRFTDGKTANPPVLPVSIT